MHQVIKGHLHFVIYEKLKYCLLIGQEPCNILLYIIYQKSQYTVVNVFILCISATNLCIRAEDNDCDDLSTNCSSMGDGTFACPCRQGFKQWRDLTNICQGQLNFLFVFFLGQCIICLN